MNQKFLSIAIPTYNRANCLKRLLDNIVPQVLKFREMVEICISNNGSPDNTKEVVMAFKGKYPDLIKYRENEKNLGYDINFLEVVRMVVGEFVWPFSDDSLFADNALEEVIGFLKENKNKKIGGAVIKDVSYIVDEKTGKRTEYHSSVDKAKPEKYGGLNFIDMARDGVPYEGFCLLIFNNKLLQKILKEYPDLVKRGIGSYYLHSWLFLLLFLLNKDAKYYVLNKPMMISPDTLSKYKFLMEDQFQLIYKGRIEFFENLLSVVDKSDKTIVRAVKELRRRPILGIMFTMALFKAFGLASYRSGINCIKLAFKNLPFLTALLISIFLLLILVTPSKIVKKMCRFSLRIKFKNKEKAESNWSTSCAMFTHWNKGERSIIE
jgi:glycosyltransferase involved in cell wall biosynthesis